MGYKTGVEREWPAERILPSFEERQQILARAGVVLAEARTLLDYLDHPGDSYLAEVGIHLAHSRADSRKERGRLVRVFQALF